MEEGIFLLVLLAERGCVAITRRSVHEKLTTERCPEEVED